MENNTDIISKYSNSVIKNLDNENINKIIEYLNKQNCIFIDDIVSDYLDILTIDYDEFVKIIDLLNKKYNNQFFYLASKDLNYLEEIYNY